MRNIKVSHSYIFFFFLPLFFNFSCWSTLKSLMIQARCFSFIFFLFLFFFLKKSFIASIMQKVKCNRDVFPWWILQKKKKNTIKRARWKTDIHAVYASISVLGILFACSFHNLPVTMSRIFIEFCYLIEFFWICFPLNFSPQAEQTYFITRPLFICFFDNSGGNYLLKITSSKEEKKIVS